MVHSLGLDKLKALYKTMRRIRSVEERIASVYHEGKMRCPTHLSIGQEAVPAIISLYSKPTDYAISTHRGHAHYLAKGGALNAMIAELYGKQTGCSKGKGGSMHLCDASVNFVGTTAIVGGSIPVGVGLALDAKIKGKEAVSIVYLGDGASEEGVFYESVNFCALKSLPVLFVCENNFYSVYTNLNARQPAERKLHEMVSGIGVSALHSTDRDLPDLDGIISSTMEEVRKDKKPYFLEIETYRWREHCGPNFDNDIGYRTEAEFESWRKTDPLTTVEAELIKSQNGITFVNDIKEAIELEINVAFQFAEQSDFPHLKERELGVYA